MCQFKRVDQHINLCIWEQLGLDTDVEQLAVHRAVDHPGRVQPIMAQGRDEGLCVPVTKGGVVDQVRTQASLTSGRQSSPRRQPARDGSQPETAATLPWPPPFPCKRGSSPTVSRFRITMSLTNFTETRKRAAAARCECPSSTSAKTRSRSAIGCGLPISNPHICHADRESEITPRRNPESERPQQALDQAAIFHEITTAATVSSNW